MTNEIKEIIEYLENPDFYVEDFGFSYKRISLDETNILLDYITNLQEENERLKLNQTKKVFDTIAGLIKNGETCSYRYLIYDLLGFQEKDYVDLMGGLAITNMLVDYEDYKQRIDKAINYILENICCDTRVYTKSENVYKVVDILRGDE